MIQLIGTVILAAGVVGSLAFIGAYSYYTDWWRSEIGWHLVTFVACLLVLEVNAVAVRLFGDYPGRGLVNLAAFGGMVAATWWRAALVIRSNRRRRGARDG